MEKVIGQNVWYNWCTSDESTGILNWMFQNNLWVEIQKDSRSVYLAPKATTTTMWNNTTDWFCQKVLPHFDLNVYTFYANWKVYKWSSSYWTKTAELSIKNAIYFPMSAGWGAWSSDFVVTSNTKISRIKAGTLTAYEDFDTHWGGQYTPMIVFLGDLYIGSWNVIYKLTSTAVKTTACTVSSDEAIIALLPKWSQIIIVTTRRIYYWDWIDSLPQDVLPYSRYVIRWSEIIGNKTYIFADDSAYSYILSPNGLWYDELFKKPILSDNSPKVASYGGINDTTVVGKTVYFTSIGWISTYWSNFLWMPDAYSRPFSISWWVNAMEYDQNTGRMYVWHYNTPDWWVTYTNYLTEYNLSFSGNEYVSTGNIVTLPFYSDYVSDEKKWTSMQVWFSLNHTSCSIDVYKSIDNGSWTLIKTLNTTDYWTWTNKAILSVVDTFHNIRFKFTLNTSNSGYTPKLHDYKFKYDTTKQFI